MKQLDLFSFEDDARLYDVICMAKSYNPSFEVAAVYLPDKELIYAEPSFAIKADGKLKFYQILRGVVQHFSNSPLDTRDEVPNRYWIEV